MTTASQPDLNQLVNEFLVNGFVVFEELIPLALIDAIYAQCRPFMDRVEGWNSTQLKGNRETGQGRVTQKQRFKIYPPFNGPSADPIIMENPLVLQFLERIWGNDDIELTSYSSNCPAPGTLFQNWHRDGMLMAANLALPVYPCLSLKFPLVDTSEANGSTELIPCTHHCSISALHHEPGSETARSLNAIIESGRFPSKMRLNLKRGSAWIADPRLIHRGTPNGADHTRIELSIDYTQSWFGGRDRDAVPELKQAQFESLSDCGKQLLRHCAIADG